MSTEKSFLDDNGLQRLWQKITATVTNSVSAAINALPSWAKSETKPSYTVSEISDAVSDTTFNNHVNDTNAHVSESDREIWDDVTRYHKYKYDLPTTGTSDGYVSFSKGYVNADYSLFAVDGNGKIAYCPNGYGAWNLYPRQLPETALNKENYQIAVFNNTIYISFIDSGSHIWKYNLEADEFVCIATISTVQYLPFIICMAVANYSGSEQLFCFGQSISPNSSKDAIRIDANDNITFFGISDFGSMGTIVQVEVDSLKDIMILNDSGNNRLLLMIDGNFPSSAYYIEYPMSITITDFCAMHDNNNWYCLVIDHLKKKLYRANFLSGLTLLSDTELSYYNSIPKIAAYQENTNVPSVILMMGGIGCRYSNISPYTSYSNASLGGMPNYMENIVHLDYCSYSNAWFGITKTGKCLFSKDITATDNCWSNFTPHLLDKDGTDISGSVRDIIGAMNRSEAVELINQVTDGVVKYNAAQSLTDTQKNQARSNIGAESLLVGDIKASLNRSQPDNWLKCDGSPVRISDYPKLGEVIGVSVYKTSTSIKIGDSSIYYNAINVAYKSNVFCEVDGKYYYPLLSADRKTVTIVSIADDGSSVNTHGTITTSSGTAINAISNIVWCWNTYNIVLFTASSVNGNALTLTYYIAKGKSPDTSSWSVSGPYTLTSTANLPNALTGCELTVTSDGNNLIISVGYRDNDGWNCAIAIIPYSLSSARMQHLFGPSTYNRMVSIEYVDHKYFLNMSDTEITNCVTDVENKIAFFRDIDSISIEYLNLDLPSPYQLTAFSYYGFLGVQKIGSKFRAYLTAREDVTVNSSTKYIRSIYVYESNTSDFTTYTTKVVYRDVYKTNASFQYLIDSGLYIYLVYDYYGFTKIVVMDPNDPTSNLASYIASRSTNNSMLWNRWKVLSMMPDSDIIKIISGVFSGSSSPYTLNAYITSFSDPEKFAVLPSISKDSQGYRYIKVGN